MGVRVLAVVVLLLAGCGSATPAAAPRVSAVPAGWRYESYRGVQLTVPDSWGYGTSGSPSCAVSKAPYVGRPGPVPAIGCTDDGEGYRTGTFVWFSPASSATAPPARGDRETVVVGGAQVEVQASADLRRKILASVRAVTTDAQGCPTTAAFGPSVTWRPPAGRPVSELSGVTGVSACRYDVASVAGALVSSVRLSGPEAAREVAALAAAPVGGGPNRPEWCVAEHTLTGELIDLIVSTRAGDTHVVVRYDGCDHHGIDDGTELRQLTHAAVAPLVAGPNQVTSFSEVLAGVL